jgi:hypothetical protein
VASGADAFPVEPGVGGVPGPRSEPVDVIVCRSGQCGSWKDAVATVRESAVELGRRARIRVVVVRSLAESERLRFHGSPSVVLDGIDDEGPDVEKRPSSFGLRLYREGGALLESPSKIMVLDAMIHDQYAGELVRRATECSRSPIALAANRAWTD